MLVAQGYRSLQRAEPGLGSLIHGKSILDPELQLVPAQILREVEDLSEAHPHRAALDVAVDRPKVADKLLLCRSARPVEVARWSAARSSQ